MNQPPATPDPALDPWLGLRRFTAARIALGRTGGSQRTDSVLDFRLSHARARDAVHARLDTAALAAALAASGLPAIELATAVTDRAGYLLRPDLGRRLAPAALAQLSALASTPDYSPPDLVVIVSDGLAAQAAERHAAPTIVPLVATLADAGWCIAPIVIAPFARVKLQDEIGAVLRARYTLMLLGERPGLGAPDSLGAYFTASPGPERTDADRNCVSNIRPEGLPPARAAEKLAWLLLESARTGLAGVQLKDTQPSSTLI
jgi:ethanolamine ammonia-lyase small subunit